PLPYHGSALPTELKRQLNLNKKSSASRARTYDIMINSHALCQLSYCGMKKIYPARQRPTLTGPKVQLPSALRSLTAVFGMGTGVSFLPSSPHRYIIFFK